MRKGVLFVVFLLLIPTVYAGMYNVTIGEDTFNCGEEDGICPSDYSACEPCLDSDDNYVDDPDCCDPIFCTDFWCTEAGVVCGDSSDETTKYETDSEGDNVDGTGDGNSIVEDCSGTCAEGTEEVIDDSNAAACLDTAYDDADSCADDGEIYSPISTTSDVCSTDVSCHDNDEDGDYEVCSGGNWHDPDESETYCDAVSGTWVTIETGTDADQDDYDTDLSNGYCSGDDGYVVTGAIVLETYRGSGYCEAAEDVTITIKDVDDTSIEYLSTTTEYSESWDEALSCYEDSTANDVGEYTFSIDAGTYYLVAEKDGYNTVTKLITVSTTEEDNTFSVFWMYLNEGCQSDCTMNDNTCYAECEGVNGCTFPTYDETGESVANYCDSLKEGYRYVLSETESDGEITGDHVYCCNNEPEAYSREYFSAEDAQTNCVENVISKKKGFWLNGEWVYFNFVLFSDPHPEKVGCNEYSEFACELYGDAFC